MLEQIGNMREVRRRCTAGEPLSKDLAGWLANAFDDFLSQRARSLHDAFDLNFPKGGVPWWQEEAIRKRDAALRELARRYHTEVSMSAKSRQIRTSCERYAATAWRFDRNRQEMPVAYLETPKELIWRAFKSGAAMPLGERQLRNILAY